MVDTGDLARMKMGDLTTDAEHEGFEMISIKVNRIKTSYTEVHRSSLALFEESSVGKFRIDERENC